MTTSHLGAEIGESIGKAASTLARLTARVWTSPKPSVNTKMAVYNACVISTLLWQRDMDHICLRRILRISWQDKVTNADVLSRAGLPTMYTLHRQHTLRWLGHVRPMEDGRIPKRHLRWARIGEDNHRPPRLRYQDVCMIYMKPVDIDSMPLQLSAHRQWRGVLK